MFTLSATCVAIAIADKAGTLRMVERPSRFGGTFIALEDARGLIEVAMTMEEARDRVETLRARWAR
jgi:hypothetical protein